MSHYHQAITRFGLALAVTLSLSTMVSAKKLTEALADAGFQDIAEDVEACVTTHSPLNPVIAVESFANRRARPSPESCRPTPIRVGTGAGSSSAATAIRSSGD